MLIGLNTVKEINISMRERRKKRIGRYSKTGTRLCTGSLRQASNGLQETTIRSASKEKGLKGEG